MKYHNILVTGAAGFVGSHLVKTLTDNKARVISLDINDDPRSYFFTNQLHRKSQYIKLDINNLPKLSALILKEKIDCVFHLAAQPLVEKAFDNPADTLQTNILGTVNVLESARKYGKVKAIIVASSDKAYGKMGSDNEWVTRGGGPQSATQRIPGASTIWGCQAAGPSGKKVIKQFSKYRESDPLSGDHPYEVSKSSADLICQTYIKTYNMPVVITRFGNIYGEGDLYFSRLIPGVMKALVNKKVFNIRSDGKYVRDYLYVKDVVKGYLMLADNISKAKGEAFNFGSDDTYSVLSLISLISQICQIHLKYRILDTAQNEIPYQSLDWTKVNETIGWKPEYTIEKTIKKIFDWYEGYFRQLK